MHQPKNIPGLRRSHHESTRANNFIGEKLRHIIDLHAVSCQLGYRAPKGEVASHMQLKPITVGAGKDRNLMPANFFRSSIHGCAIAL
jgi:hypothetical protein